MNKNVFYFIVDATHQDFDAMKTEAEAANAVNVGTELSWFYNNDQTKAEVKVVGTEPDWYAQGFAWYGHPAILQVFQHSNHDALITELNKTEWRPTGGSPMAVQHEI